MFPEGKDYQIFSSKTFLYNPETQEFIINGISIKARDLSDIEELNPITSPSGQTEFPADTPMVIGDYTHCLIGLPYFRLWLSQRGENPEIKKIVEQSMKEIMKMSDFPSIKTRAPRGRSFLSYNLEINISGSGIFKLITLGNCACLGYDLDPFINYGDEYTYTVLTNVELPNGYTLHNADTSFRRLSLYAGAGTLAWLSQQ